jgi:hypothetical protein
MGMDMQHGPDMQHGYGHAAWIWTCSMDKNMQLGNRLVEWTWICSMDLDIHACPIGSSDFLS